MKKIGKIYTITNLINNKMYIGQTIQTLKKRRNEHICNAFTRNKKSKLYTAMRKYGSKNFKFQLLEKNISLQELNSKEEHYIKFFNTVENGYNTLYRERAIRTLKEFDIKQIIKLYKNGKTLKEIATKYKSDKRTVSSILRENDVEIRNWNKEQSNPEINKDVLYDLYINKSMLIKEIGDFFGLSNTAIRNWMIKFDIPRRLPHNYKELKCRS